MFFKKNKTNQERKLDMGDFGSVPRDIMQQIVLFLDARSLANLLLTNSSVYEVIFKLPQVHIKICNQEFKGSFPQFLNLYANYLNEQQSREKEIKEISDHRMILREKKADLQEWTAPSRSKNFHCITDDEKMATGCCFVFGVIGGVLVSCFVPVPCFLSTTLGAVAGGTTPLVVCRTTKCLCGMCLECKEDHIDEREKNLNSNFPPAQFTMNM